VSYLQQDDAFVATAASTVVPSPKQSDLFWVYTKAEQLRSDAEKRAPGTEGATRSYAQSTSPFFCDVYSIAINVSKQFTANADSGLDPEEDAARQVAQDIKIRMEQDFATAAFGTSGWGTHVTGGTDFTVWSNQSSTPILDLTTGINTVEAATGYRPNRLVIGGTAWNTGLLNHEDIIARLPDTSLRAVTPSALSSLLDVEVVIARSIRNTADEGLTASYSRNLGNHALLMHIDPGAGLRGATAMRTFTWAGFAGNASGVMTTRYDVPKEDAFPRVESFAAYDIVITASDLGYMLNSVV
jgi:hypothetical protein